MARKAPTLPPQIAMPADIGRLRREIEQIDQALLQLKLRNVGDKVKLPKTSLLMDQIVEHNKLNLLDAEERAHLKRFLELVEQKAPCLHFSFNADPSIAFTEKLVKWLRDEIHPQTLITFGLQPNIGAGCIVRTTNKQFDFSLRQTFIDHRPQLLERLSHD